MKIIILSFLVLAGCHKTTSPEYVKFKLDAKKECTQKCEAAGSKFLVVEIMANINGDAISYECKCESVK